MLAATSTTCRSPSEHGSDPCTVRCPGEVDRRDLPPPERLPPDLDRRPQEVVPLQPGPVRDQQFSRRLGRQPALRPRPDRLSEVLEARSKTWVSFDHLDRGWLARFLRHRIADERILRLVAKWLNAGVLEDG
jgi:hypothetical protein